MLREMTAEHAAIGVKLVDDDEFQVLEQLRPARMVRQDARVHHVGIAEHHVRLAANGAARVRRRIAVVGKDPDLDARIARDDLREAVQFGELILREGLGRKQIERPRRRVLQDRVQHRRVVAERFARGGRRDGDDVAPGEHVLERLGLVRVELLDAPRRQRPAQPVVGLLRERRERCGYGRQAVSRRDDRVGIPPERRPGLGQPGQGVLKGSILVAADDREGLGSHGQSVAVA